VTLGAEWSCSIVDERLRVDVDLHHHVLYSHPSSESGRDTRLEYQGHQSLSSAENQVHKPPTLDPRSVVSIHDRRRESDPWAYEKEQESSRC
jgi:hypothetical protein